MPDTGEKVVALHGQILPTEPTVVPAVVEAIEELLAMARAGEIVGIAYATVHPGDATNYWCVGHHPRALLGAIELCKFEICRSENDR